MLQSCPGAPQPVRQSHFLSFLWSGHATAHISDFGWPRTLPEHHILNLLHIAAVTPLSALLVRHVSGLGSNPDSIGIILSSFHPDLPLGFGFKDGAVWTTCGALRDRLKTYLSTWPAEIGIEPCTNAVEMCARMSKPISILYKGVQPGLVEQDDHVGLTLNFSSESETQSVEMILSGIVSKFISGLMEQAAKLAIKGQRQRQAMEL